MPKTDVNGERRIGDVGIAGSLFVPQHVKGVKERILYAFRRYFLSWVSYFYHNMHIHSNEIHTSYFCARTEYTSSPDRRWTIGCTTSHLYKYFLTSLLFKCKIFVSMHNTICKRATLYIHCTNKLVLSNSIPLCIMLSPTLLPHPLSLS